MPKISVIVPVYGVEQYIVDCLRSIAAQTFADYELILVDDGSQDRSVELAEAYLNTTTLNWRLLRQENAGQGLARDYGIREATGEYVVCVDADDTVAPCFLQALYGAACEMRSVVTFSSFQITSMAETPARVNKWNAFTAIGRTQMLHTFLCRTIVPILPAMLIQRSFLLESDICVPANCRFTEDLYVMWRIFATAERVSFTTSRLYNYLHRPNSTMTASSGERIMTGYHAFESLLSDHIFAPDFQERRFILPRWVFGALNSTARIASDYDSFFAVAEQMEYQRHMAALHDFPEWRTRVLACMLRVSPKVYYRLLHGRIIR